LGINSNCNFSKNSFKRSCYNNKSPLKLFEKSAQEDTNKIKRIGMSDHLFGYPIFLFRFYFLSIIIILAPPKIIPEKSSLG